MEAYLALTQPTQVNKITTSCEICSGPHDTYNCIEGTEQTCVDYVSSCTNEMGGKRITSNQGPRNFNDATDTWKDKPNFNWGRTQTFTNAQNGSIFVYSSSYQIKLEKALLDFDSNQEKRLSHLRTQLGQQQDDMIGKINLLWKTVSEKLNDVSTPENAGNSMAHKSIAAISHDEREELRKKGIKSPSKLFSPKYLSPASIKELNKNPSAPKRVHFVNSIVILSTDSDTEEEDISSTNTHEHELGNMVRRGEEVKEQGKEEDEMEYDVEVEELINEEESKFKTDEEVEEIFKEEEEDEDDENFNSFPTMKELSHHEWLLKNPRPPWVKAKIRVESLNNIKISCMIGHFFKRHAYIDLESPINIMSRRQYNQIMTYELRSKRKPSNPDKISNFVGRVRRLKIFIGSFAYECDFMILEDTTSIIDRHLEETVFIRPFIDETGLVYNKEEGMVMFKQDDEKITFKMPHTIEIFKQTRLMGLSTDSIPPSAHEENFAHRRTHYYQSLLIRDKYKQDGGDRRGIKHLMRLEKEMMDNKGKVTLYLMRRSLEVLRKFHWMILRGRFDQYSHVSSPLLSKPGEYYFAFGRHLEEIHVTWAHLEKKRTRLQTYTNIAQEFLLRSWRRRHRLHVTPLQRFPRRRHKISRRRQIIGPLRCWPGGLCLSRSIGDLDVGEFIVPVPYVKQVKLSSAGGRMIIASDGVWDAMSAEAALVCSRGLPPDTAAAQIVKVQIQIKFTEMILLLQISF
ncbi:protein kinase-like domain, concanavalin A-like lectin/glucanase domain protein [Tanacetum coccineum]